MDFYRIARIKNLKHATKKIARMVLKAKFPIDISDALLF